jgi:prepilin-type N-terminal cleavage/methylation domain-containing protein
MNSRRAGYSLLEVLIAFAIMSLVLAVLLPGQSRLLGRAVSANETLLARDYAESLIAGYGFDRATTEGERTFETGDWQVEEVMNEMQDPLPHVQVTITIRKNGTVLARAETLVAMP